MFALKPYAVFVTLAGSHAHGTAREGSDVDLRGVCVAPLAIRLSLFGSFEQYEGRLDGELAEAVVPRLRTHPTACRGLRTGIECVIFDIAKFVGLCTAANPNALEILFADEADWLYETAAWRQLHDHRHRFLTKKVQHTFLGYAMAQLKKIKSHRSWLLNPPTKKPTRAHYGLPAAGTLGRDDQNRVEQGIAEKLRSYGIDDIDMPKAARIAVQERIRSVWVDVLAASEEDLEHRVRAVASHAVSLPSEVIATLNAEKRYRAAMRRWESYQAWQAQRNPARGELERRHGYDTKHAMHLIRLMRMGLEALQHGDLTVRRPDAEDLVAIRDGKLSFDELLEQAKELKTRMETAAKSSSLPEDVDRDDVDRLAFGLMKESLSLDPHQVGGCALGQKTGR